MQVSLEMHTARASPLLISHKPFVVSSGMSPVQINVKSNFIICCLNLWVTVERVGNY